MRTPTGPMKIGDDWLRPYEKAPPLETMRVYGGSDYAVSSGMGDYTVHAVVGFPIDDGSILAAKIKLLRSCTETKP